MLGEGRVLRPHHLGCAEALTARRPLFQDGVWGGVVDKDSPDLLSEPGAGAAILAWPLKVLWDHACILRWSAWG